MVRYIQHSHHTKEQERAKADRINAIKVTQKDIIKEKKGNPFGEYTIISTLGKGSSLLIYFKLSRWLW
jgi:hypothetical protein